jgi:hypothetical protein
LKNLLNRLFLKSNFVQFHVAAWALATTGVFMVATSSDLGVLAPLVISLGIYALVFALSLEVYLGLYQLLAFSVSRLFKNEIPTVAELPFGTTSCSKTK